jgi:O-antigen/teichoic acid export membrane protein
MKLVSTVSWSALATLMRLANGFISIKVVAVIIGPVGIALLGQFSNLIQIIMVLSLGGISNGIIKYTSEFKDNYEELQKIWSTVLHNWLAQELLQNPKYGIIILIFAFTLTFYVANNLLLNILNGMHQIKEFNIMNVVNSSIGLIVSILLVYYYKIFGALLAIVTSQSVSFFVMISFVYKKKWFKLNYFCGKFNKFYFKKLLGYTSMAVTSICVLPTGQMIIRTFLSHSTSWRIAGCWQGMQKISDSYLMIVYAALGTYFLPKYANLYDTQEIKNEVLRGYKLIMPFIVISIVSIYVLRDFIINILFAKSFATMRDMFIWQLTGDFFKISCYLIAYLMLAKSKIKIFIITEIVFGVSYIIFSYIFISLSGANGSVQAFALNYFIYFILFLVLYKKGVLF